MHLDPPPTRPITGTTTITELLSLRVGDHVVAIGIYSRMHGIGKIAAIRDKLIAVKFESGQVAEFTELQLRKVNP